MKATYLFFLCLMLTLLACDELEQPPTNKFVVEAFITADQAISDIKIKESSDLIADTLLDVPISDATVRLISGNENVLLSFNSNSGKYFLDGRDFDITSGQTYELLIEANGVNATATTVVPEPPTGLQLSGTVLTIPPLAFNFGLRAQIQQLFSEERITFSWASTPGGAYFVVIETLEAELDPILPPQIPEQSQELLGSFRFISAPSEDNSFEIIGIALETYGRHVARVYRVNQEYVDLFNSATQDSRDLNEPPTNLTNALGIFTAFAVDSLEFEVVRE